MSLQYACQRQNGEFIENCETTDTCEDDTCESTSCESTACESTQRESLSDEDLSYINLMVLQQVDVGTQCNCQCCFDVYLFIYIMCVCMCVRSMCLYTNTYVIYYNYIRHTANNPCWSHGNKHCDSSQQYYTTHCQRPTQINQVIIRYMRTVRSIIIFIEQCFKLFKSSI